MYQEKKIEALPFFLKSLFTAISLSLIIVFSLLWFLQREQKIGGDFTLKDREASWTFLHHAKDLNLLYIGYAKCPDVCPMTLSVAAQAFQRLDVYELKKVNLLFLSVDYEHDLPADVADYASDFFPDFIGLTGSKKQIDQTVSLYGVNYIFEKTPNSYLGYSIAHPDRLFFLDNKGYVIGTISNPRSPDIILQSIKENL